MPSLNELGQFKDSFRRIGGEKAGLEAKNALFDDLGLPVTEGTPVEILPRTALKSGGSSKNETDSADNDILSDFILSDDNLPEDDENSDAGDFDFKALLGTTSGSLNNPAQESLDDEPFELGDEPFDLGEESSENTVGEFGLDDEPFELGDEPFDLGEESGENTAGEFGLDDEPFELGNEPFDLGEESSENTAREFGLDDEPFELGNEPFDLGEESQDEKRGLLQRGMRLRSETEAPNFGLFDTNFDSELNQGSGNEQPENSENYNSSLGLDGDGFDNFNVGGESDTLTGFDDNSASTENPGPADFSIPDLDALLTAPAAKHKKETRFTPAASDSVEEIQLSHEDMASLQKTLSGYPLNLRIACQELIAEHILASDQLSGLIKLLVKGAPAKETAAFASKILDKPIKIPKGFEKSTGAALEEEQGTFTYIFVRRFLPILWRFTLAAILLACIGFLSYTFILTPRRAEILYRRGYEQIFAGQYQNANELFWRAFGIHRNRNWFYRYAEAFIYVRRFMLAEEKYEALLRYFPRDKRGVLDFARLQTNYLMNFERASQILRHNLLDFNPDDFDGLLALGDNYLAWADSNPQRYWHRYEDARFAFARIMENYGWQPPVVERMLQYFIRTDNLREVLHLKNWFDEDRRRRPLSALALAEIGGYLLDKQLERPVGVPSPYLERIGNVLDILQRAVRLDPSLPEPHYHLARFFGRFGNLNIHEERVTLENAILAFDHASEESIRRRLKRIDAHRRYANVLVRQREFFHAEEHLIRGINLYEDFLARNLITPSPEFGRLYADLGDLEFFVKEGDMRRALHFYHLSASHGWSPPEIQYRMGAAYYQLEDWGNARYFLFQASTYLPLNRRVLFALGNVAFQRGDYFSAQGYYNRLIELLESQRDRIPVLLPNDHPDFLELGERLMWARNNAGVVYEVLASQTGNTHLFSRAMALYTQSANAWDSITRNPVAMTRATPFYDDDPGAPSVNLGFQNMSNALNPVRVYQPQIFVRIDKDALEPSSWEALLPNPALNN